MIISLQHCDQCGTCIAVCPADAMMLDEFKVKIDYKACTECGICVKMCPIAALEVKNEV
ncbi:MAG: 4Fe-4S binding protein [Candidatus Marinimicrobia bacterium]|nr:4Fe-4S binding protein [Candidatus Neomarinimicrobiota bacterium]